MQRARLLSLVASSAFAFGSTAATTVSPVAAAGLGPSAAPAVLAGVPRLAGLRDLGPAPRTAPLHLTVALAYRNEPELDALVEMQGDPASPAFHHFLTRAQFDAAFSPSPDAYARVAASLQRAGFRIERGFANRLTIDAVAPVPIVERYFATSIHDVQRSGASVRFTNVRPALAPQDVAGLVSGVVGLENLRDFHTFAHFASEPTFRAQAAGPGRIIGPGGGYGPVAFLDAYDIPAGTYDGKNQSSGIVIPADFLDSDVSGYLAQFGIYHNALLTHRIQVDGGPDPKTNPPGVAGNEGSEEATLDVETILSIAPGTNLYVYEFPNFNPTQYILDAYEQVVTDDVVGTVNSSFGGCEEAPQFGQQDNFAVLSDRIAVQGAALGITFHAATGDAGNVGTYCASTSVNSPASDPHFVAVGGTALYLDPSSGKVAHEFGWGGLNATSADGATGGGVSAVFHHLPSYQQGIANVVPYGRNLPDVSFDADPATGAAFYYGGAFSATPIGGTSLASPIFGAAQTIVNEMNGAEAGFVNPAIYRAFRAYGYAGKTAGSPIFRDITVGNNGFYPAGPGYDQMTGIGSELIDNLSPLLRP